jgi:cytoskeletal protein CcmA (bactofilin family)
MSCRSELSYAIYVDGELPPEERRPLEAHLVACRTCRERVVALREEAEALAGALQERDPAPLHAGVAAPPARGLALGLAPALLATTLASVALGWLVDEAWPALLPVVSPLGLGGLYGMAFDLLYVLRERAPEVLDVGVAVAAMASVSALLCFGLGLALRRWSAPTLLAFSALLALAGAGQPGEARAGFHEQDDYTLPAGEVYEGTLVVHGESVTVEGVVDGDLLAFTRRLVLRGEVRGSLVAAARDVQIEGDVSGTALVVGRSTRVSGRVRGNLYGFGGESFDVERSARLERDLAAGGEQVRIEGSVGRDLYAGGDEVVLRGEVGRNVHAWADSLSLREGSRVAGDVDAALPPGVAVEVAESAFVGGETTSHVQEHGHARRGFARLGDPRWWGWLALHVAAALPVGLLLHALLPGLFAARLETSAAFFRALGLGFAGLVLPPLAAAALALTLVGVPLALMGLMLWIVALYTALVLVAFLVGRSLLPPRDESWTAFGLALLVGLVVVVFAVHAPYLGHALLLLALLSGLGLLVERARGGWAALTARQG